MEDGGGWDCHPLQPQIIVDLIALCISAPTLLFTPFPARKHFRLKKTDIQWLYCSHIWLGKKGDSAHMIFCRYELYLMIMIGYWLQWHVDASKLIRVWNIDARQLVVSTSRAVVTLTFSPYLPPAPAVCPVVHRGLKWGVRWGVSPIWPKTQF